MALGTEVPPYNKRTFGAHLSAGECPYRKLVGTFNSRACHKRLLSEGTAASPLQDPIELPGTTFVSFRK